MKKVAEDIFMLFGNGYNCNSYLLSSSNKEYLLIDSGLGKFDMMWGQDGQNTSEELKNVFNMNITKVILTHAHLDHIGGIISLNEEQRKNIEVYCHIDEKKYIEKPDSQYIDPLMNIDLDPLIIDHTFEHEEKFTFGDFSFEVLHTPGHTQGSICLFDSDKKILFSGDCVFPQGSFGRVDFPGSNPEKMISSLEILSSLEVQTLFAGHMDPLITNAKDSINFSCINAKHMLLGE